MDVRVSQERREPSAREPTESGAELRDEARTRRSPALRTLVLALVAALSGAAAGAVVARRGTSGTQSAPPTNPSPSMVATVVAAVGPSVVSIRTRPLQIDQLFDKSSAPGSGTGIVIRSDGMILTDAALVATARPISVRLADGRALPATVIGRDPADGIAVLKVAAHGLRVAPLVGRGALVVGDDVVALGDPLALPGGPTVSRGVVAALHRTIAMPASDATAGLPARLSGLIQVTDALGDGAEGGPVVNARGDVVGVATLTAGGGARAPGFAIDVARVRDAIGDLERGHAPADSLGVEAVDVTPVFAHAYKLPVESGAFVASVVPGSPAARGGLRADDIVVGVGHERIATGEDLDREAREPSVTTMPLVVVRGSRTITVTVSLR